MTFAGFHVDGQQPSMGQVYADGYADPVEPRDWVGSDRKGWYRVLADSVHSAYPGLRPVFEHRPCSAYKYPDFVAETEVDHESVIRTVALPLPNKYGMTYETVYIRLDIRKTKRLMVHRSRFTAARDHDEVTAKAIKEKKQAIKRRKQRS